MERSGSVVRVLDSRPRGQGFEPHRSHCVVSEQDTFIHAKVLVQPRKTRPYITERLLMGRKESNQKNKNNTSCWLFGGFKGFICKFLASISLFFC